MPRKGSKSKVSTSRVYELYCEDHGVLECHPQYQRVREERENHRALHPECFAPQPAPEEPTETNDPPGGEDPPSHHTNPPGQLHRFQDSMAWTINPPAAAVLL